MSIFKPMLSGKFDPAHARFPYMASPKVDGIRCLIRDGVALSRTMKPLPNQHIQSLLGRPEFNGLDGEIVVGDAADPDVYRKTNSAVMSVEGTPDFVLWTFDRWDHPLDPFEERYALALPPNETPYISRLPHAYVISQAELDVVLEDSLARGFEGVMLRDPNGMYKYGRSTVRENGLLKVKIFDDMEAEVVGTVDEMHNGNEAQQDAFGRTKRSSHQANKTSKGTMGALNVRGLNGPYTNVSFSIGTGFTAQERAQEWRIGEIVKLKYMAHGAKDRPRHPVFLGRRDAIDVVTS